MHYELESETPKLVLGIGPVEPGKVRTVTQEEALWFKRLRGVPLSQANVPTGVTVTVVAEEE